MLKYEKVQCACGRTFGRNVFRPHARKCLAQLRVWAAEGRDMRLLDEREDKSEPLGVKPQGG